uniref:Uncharacterized protein n=1 Tax=Lepeophtheirus salmonis TaxID=72036 RepID=A0A0K2THL6_LEPSM
MHGRHTQAILLLADKNGVVALVWKIRKKYCLVRFILHGRCNYQ